MSFIKLHVHVVKRATSAKPADILLLVLLSTNHGQWSSLETYEDLWCASWRDEGKSGGVTNSGAGGFSAGNNGGIVYPRTHAKPQHKR